jgi:dCTP deaminase
MTLSSDEITARLKLPFSDTRKIVITPILDLDDQLGPSGVDIRLGKQFIVFREHFKGTFSIADKENLPNKIKKYQEEIVVPFGNSITLHPGKLIVGSTLEYVSVPRDLECQVEGRSSWARLGLMIATATTVEPGYKGMVTLELSNNGTIPIELFPGIKIGQLLFHKNTADLSKEIPKGDAKKYNKSVGPGYSQIYKDKHLEYFYSKKPS